MLRTWLSSGDVSRTRKSSGRAIGRVRSNEGSSLYVPWPEARRQYTTKVSEHENGSLLWWSGHANSRCVREHTEADATHRRQANPLAPHALLQSVQSQGFRVVPWLQGQRGQGLLPELQAAVLCRLRRLWLWRESGDPGRSPTGLACHHDRHGHLAQYRTAPVGRTRT